MKLLLVFFFLPLIIFYEFLVFKMINLPELPRKNTDQKMVITSIFWLLVILKEVTLQIISYLTGKVQINHIKVTVLWAPIKVRGPTDYIPRVLLTRCPLQS